MRSLLRYSARPLLVGLLLLLSAGAASAAPGTVLRDPNAIQDLGPWYSQNPNSAGATTGVFQPTLNPVSNLDAPESLNFACTYPKGYPALAGTQIDTQTLAYYSGLVSVARDVYAQPGQDHREGIFYWDANNDNL